MRHRPGVSLALALTIAAVLVTAAGAGETARQRKAPSSPRLRAQVVTFSGSLSGPIADGMRVGGIAYRVAPDVRIFEIGRGVVPAGTSYFDRVVTVSGIKVRDTFVVQSVLVRPDAWAGSGGGAGVESDSSPR